MSMQEKVIAFAAGAILLVSVVMGYAALFAQPKLAQPISALPGVAADEVTGELSINLPDPTADPSTTAKEPPKSQPAAIFPLDLNSASVHELTLLPGIGPVLAQRIIDHRKAVGRFDSVSQLQDVKGIGPKKFADIKDLVTVGE